MRNEKQPLVLLPSSGLALVRPQDGGIVAEMVSGALVRVREALVPRYKIGDHVFCEPDYQQILLWANVLKLDPETVIEGILTEPEFEWDHNSRSQIADGRIIQLYWDMCLLPLDSFEWTTGLAIKSITFTFSRTPPLSKERSLTLPLPELQFLKCGSMRLISLDLSAVSKLRRLNCSGNLLEQLDLSALPLLTHLSCGVNKLTSLDLHAVPELVDLWCDANHLTSLDLTANPNLIKLYCDGNQLTSLDLSGVPHLTDLNCWDNKIVSLDLSAVPQLKDLICGHNQLTRLELSAVPLLIELFCKPNQITELDIRPLQNLKELDYEMDTTRLIQRPDQNF